VARPATGTVCEKPLADGSIRYAIRLSFNGQRPYETLGTSAEGWDRDRAEEALKDRLAEVRLGSYVPPRPGRRDAPVPDGAGPTFHEFASLWFATKRPELRESTVEVYLWHLRDHLLPYFQHDRLSEITIAAVDEFRQFKVNERDRMAAASDRGEDIPHRPLANETSTSCWSGSARFSTRRRNGS